VFARIENSRSTHNTGRQKLAERLRREANIASGWNMSNLFAISISSAKGRGGMCCRSSPDKGILLLCALRNHAPICDIMNDGGATIDPLRL